MGGGGLRTQLERHEEQESPFYQSRTRSKKNSERVNALFGLVIIPKGSMERKRGKRSNKEEIGKRLGNVFGEKGGRLGEEQDKAMSKSREISGTNVHKGEGHTSAGKGSGNKTNGRKERWQRGW